jgi:serine/threonine-protein kinase HipA
LDGKRTGISRKHFLGWAAGMGLTERAAVQVLELALKASGPLLADLQTGAAFSPTRLGSGRAAAGDDDGVSPFSATVTRDWIKELKHRRRLMEG